jgi:hypothetical protein
VTGWIYVDFGGRIAVAPGAVVCFDPGTGIQAQNGGRVLARGRDTAQVVLTARDPAQGWSGLSFYGSPAVASYLTNVRIEHVNVNSTAVTSWDYHPVIIDSAVIRQTGRAVSLDAPTSRISRTRVDTTTNRALPAVELGGSVRFEMTTVRRAAGVGVEVSGPSVSLLGGRIEGSGGVGLRIWAYYSPAVIAAKPIRVVGGWGIPVELPVDALLKLYPSPATQDSVRGNGRDTIVLNGGTLRGPVTIGPLVPVRVNQTLTVDSAGVFSAQPGASLVFSQYAGMHVQNLGRVSLRGTSASPVLLTADDPAWGWSGLQFHGPSSTVSYLTNTRIEHVALYSAAVTAWNYHRVIVDSSVIRQSGRAVNLQSPNSRISRTRVDTTLNGSYPAVELGSNARIESTLIRAPAGPGLTLSGASVVVVSCEIREGDQEGIVMWYPITIRRCNLVGNGGPGIDNQSGTNADVTANWWGSTGGPAGAGGDGAQGPLLTSPWRTTPYVLPYVR